MDVHDPHGELADEVRRDEPHEPREDDEVRPFLLQDFHDLALEGGPVLPEGPVVDHDGGNVRLLRPREDRRSRHVAYEDDEVRGEVPAVARVHETLEVLPLPDASTPTRRRAIGSPQCLNSRVPVKTMAIPNPSAAAITSASRIEPPGCAIATTPPFANSSRPSRNGK